jgi:hypothetical protein
MKFGTKIAVAMAAMVVVIGAATVGWSAASAHYSPADAGNVASQHLSRPAVVNPIDTSTETKFTPINPCRIVDTRSGAGKIAAGFADAFVVSGSAGFISQGGNAEGCGIPDGATAIAVTVVAVDEEGPGYLKAWATGHTTPVSSFLNYAGTSLVSTGGTIPTDGEIDVSASVNATDVVIDVDGYYVPPMFAVVNAAGTLIHGSRVASATVLTSNNQYEVDFDRNVSACAYSVSAYNSNVGVIAEPRSGNVDGVFVSTSIADTGAGLASQFYLTVTC